jgi:hypothetical protein
MARNDLNGLPVLTIDKRLDLYGLVCIPAASLRQRSYELPPRNLPFVVWGIDEIETALQVLGWGRHGNQQQEYETKETDNNGQQDEHDRGSDTLVNAQKSKRQKSSRALLPWQVECVVVMREDEVDECRQYTMTDTFTFTHRLWQPDSLVKDVLLPLLRNKLRSSNGCREIWDWGAGAGRDVAYLAKELQNVSIEYCVVAWDHRYKREVDVNECEGFMSRQGVERATRVDYADLQRSIVDDKLTLMDRLGENNKLLCIYMVRYCPVSLMEALASLQDERLAAGFIVAVSQFGKAGDTWPHTYPHVSIYYILIYYCLFVACV